METRHRLGRRPSGQRRVLHSTAFAALLLLAPLSTLPSVDAIRCLYPSYPAVFDSGTRQKVTWQIEDNDIEGFVTTRVSAFIYCMDRAGPNGGMWRMVQTLFDMQPVSYGPTVGFTVPKCGTNYGGGDGTIRVVSWRFDNYGVATMEDQCRFQILDTAKLVPEPETTPVTSSKPKPTTTTEKLPEPEPTLLPPVSTRTTATTATSQSSSSTTSLPDSIASSLPSSISSPTGMGGEDGPLPPTFTVASFPPLPPLPTMPPGYRPETDEESRRRFLQSLIGGLSGVAVVLVIVALVIRQRRRRRSGTSRGGASSMVEGGAGPGARDLRGIMARLHGKMDPNRRFQKMEDDDDGDDFDYAKHGEKASVVAGATGPGSKGSKKKQKTIPAPTAVAVQDKEAMAIKRQSSSVRIPVNLMDMDINDDNWSRGSMQVPLTPTLYAGGVNGGPSLIQPPAAAHISSDVALNDDLKWSLFMLAGRRRSYTSSRDDYSFMQQGYLDDFAEQEDDASIRHASVLRPGEMARRDSQMMQPIGSEVGGNRSSLSPPGKDLSILEDPVSDGDGGNSESASPAARATQAEGQRRQEAVREDHETRQAAHRLGGENGKDGQDDDYDGSNLIQCSSANTSATVTVATPVTASLDNEEHLKPSAVLTTKQSNVDSRNDPTRAASPSSSSIQMREDWEDTESKIANRGSRVGTLTTFRTGASSLRRRSSATAESMSIGSRRASSLRSVDLYHHHQMLARMHPLYPRLDQIPYHSNDSLSPSQQRQRLGRSASISSSFTLSSFASRHDTRLYSYTPSQGSGEPEYLHPHYPDHFMQHSSYYPPHYHHPDDPFQDSASAYAYTLDEDGLDRSSCSQAPTHLSLVSSSVDSSAVLATDPFKTFDSNNLIEDGLSR
ncbi:hypothetical protein BGW41_000926 [Actinomortierella wolfii]|nr:hypothetical protein BGW41_000926 [Actinomortierella wolfii]